MSKVFRNKPMLSRNKGGSSLSSFVKITAPPEEKSLETIVTVPRVKGAIRPQKELKFVDVVQASYALDTTGSVTLINGIAEGDDYTNRNSRSVVVVSAAVRGSAQPTLTTGLRQKCRIMLVWDNATNGAIATIGDILSTVDSGSFPDIDNEGRFTVLWDHSFVLGMEKAAVADQSIVNIEGFCKINSPMKHIGTTAGIASIQNGALYLVTVGNIAAGATAGAALLTTRIRFMENDAI